MKQIIIDKVMMKGLDPSIQIENNNCFCIKEIPLAWKIKRLKNVSDIYTGNSISDGEKSNYENDTNAFPYISSKDIAFETGSVDYKNGMYTQKTDKKFRVAPKNSTLVCIEGGSAGRKIAYLIKDVSFVNKLCCFTGTNIHPKYFNFYFQTSYFYSEFQKHMPGLIGGVSQGELKRFSILIPQKEEQFKIVLFLDERCSSMNKLITQTKSLIKLLEEYRTRFISDVVTGKMDVRNIIVPEYEAAEDIGSEDMPGSDEETIEDSND
jgi:type I restriction enzyme S subunit